MPKAIAYRANSVIYFQGDNADRIFVLQSGKVSLTYNDIETGQEVRDLIQTGEFFGVKSALSKYPREENALVLNDATVLAFTPAEFEQLAVSNTRIIMKMLKVFSSQLRRIHKQVEERLKREDEVSPEIGLYKTGEYYLKNRMYSQAKYVFSRYLTYYPAGKMAMDSSRNLEISENALQKYGQGKGPSPIFQGSAHASPSQAATRAAPPPQEQQTAPEAPRAKSELPDAAKAYYNAVSLFTQEKYQQAYNEFKKIIDANSDPEYSAKSVFELGRTMFMLNQFDATIAHFTKMIQVFPKHPDLADALFYIGQAYEKKGDKAHAAGFYKKILTMQTDEDSSVRMKAKKSLRSIEGGS
jgi:CRP-like cAMP-binding protein